MLWNTSFDKNTFEGHATAYSSPLHHAMYLAMGCSLLVCDSVSTCRWLPSFRKHVPLRFYGSNLRTRLRSAIAQGTTIHIFTAVGTSDISRTDPILHVLRESRTVVDVTTCYWLLLRGGSFPCNAKIFWCIMRPNMVSNHSWFIHQGVECFIPAETPSSESWETWREMAVKFPATKYLFCTPQGSWTCRKILQHRADGFTSPPNEVVATHFCVP
jgi:hypothetical protein